MIKSMRVSSDARMMLRRLIAASGVAILTVSAVSTAISTPAMPVALAMEPDKTKPAADEDDVLIMKGTNLEIRGRILSETDTKIKFKGLQSGISFEAEYDKSEILSIKRGKRAEDKGTPGTPKADPKTDPVKAVPAKPATDKSPDAGKSDTAAKTKVYVATLKGEFGEDISETPIRNAIKDAAAQHAEVLIFELDNKWEVRGEKRADDEYEQGFIFRSERITPILTNELPTIFQQAKQSTPRVIFWVKEAMGASALLPLCAKEIYMSEDAKIGGIGGLTQMFKSGDAVVHSKLYSAFLTHAQGWVIQGGYDPKIVNAMCVIEYVLSCKITGDQVEYFERDADVLKGEMLLTDDGTGPHMDSDRERVSGEGNDVLTLNAKLAKQLHISKGTANDLDALLFELKLDRSGVRVDSKSKSITEGWSKKLADAKKQYSKLWEEAGEVKVDAPGDYQARTKARGARQRKYQAMLGIWETYHEGFVPWHQRSRLPGDEALRQYIERQKLEQLADKPEKR